MADMVATIENKLRSELETSFVEVINESHKHALPGGNTHFKLTVVSPKFEDMRLIARHQLIYKLLNDQMESGIHALTMNTLTPEQWQQRGQQVQASPNCLGGGLL